MESIGIVATVWSLSALVFAGLLWPLSLLRRDASVTDFWWGPGVAAMGAGAWALAGAPMTGHALLIVGLLLVWGLRLGLVLGARRLREAHEDPRYTELRRAWDPGFWWKSLFVVFVLQGVLQGLVALGPVSGILAAPRAPTALAGLGAALAIGGFLLEAAADRQLDRFKAEAPAGALCTEGLRGLVRFPHYSGEMAFHGGLALIALDAGAFWAPLSALLVAALLVKVSGAPMLDEHLARTRPGYADWRARTPAFLPAVSALGRAARRDLG